MSKLRRNKVVTVNVIGAGLAGTECAYILSKNNIHVKLYEMKPKEKKPCTYFR